MLTTHSLHCSICGCPFSACMLSHFWMRTDCYHGFEQTPTLPPSPVSPLFFFLIVHTCSILTPWIFQMFFNYTYSFIHRMFIPCVCLYNRLVSILQTSLTWKLLDLRFKCTDGSWCCLKTVMAERYREKEDIKKWETWDVYNFFSPRWFAADSVGRI